MEPIVLLSFFACNLPNRDTTRAATWLLNLVDRIDRDVTREQGPTAQVVQELEEAAALLRRIIEKDIPAWQAGDEKVAEGEAKASEASEAQAPTNSAGGSGAVKQKQRSRLKREAVEPLILAHLIRKPHDAAEDVRKAVGCSAGVVVESPAWKANQVRLKIAKKEGRDPKAVKLALKAVNVAGGIRSSQEHHAHDEDEARDAEIDEREKELHKRIGDYEKEHPDATPQQVAKALSCTAGDVERRQAVLKSLAAEQGETAEEDGGGRLPDEAEPGVDLAQPRRWVRKRP